MIGDRCKFNLIMYRYFVLGCVKVNLMKEVFKNIEMGLSVKMSRSVRSLMLWLEMIFLIVECFVEKGDVENLGKLFEELNNVKYNRYVFVYNVLFKVYVKGRVYDFNLFKRMVLGGVRFDVEFYSLLKFVE